MSTETANVTKLQQLCDFLLNGLTPMIKKNNIDAWQEHGTLMLSGKDRGQGGYEVAKWKHTAVISIENLPHREINAYSLLAMVSGFLLEKDFTRDQYELNDPEIDIDVISRDNATVLIEVELIDNIELIPDVKGPVKFNGERYCVSMAPVDYAETVDVNIENQGEQG